MIPNDRNEAELLERIQVIEKIIFKGDSYESNYGKGNPENRKIFIDRVLDRNQEDDDE